MAPSPRDRRPLLLVGSILVAAVGIFILIVSGGGSNGGNASAQSTNPFSPPPTVGPSPTPPPTTQVFSGRDPFQPFGVQTTTPPFTTPPSTMPSISVSPPSSPRPAPGGGSSTTIGGHTVVLDDIFTVGGVQKAQVEVDGVVYTVAEGQKFDANFKLTDIHGSCGDFLFGDQSFTLCTTAHK